MKIVKRHGEIVVLYGDYTTYLYDDALSHEPLLYLAHDEQPIAQSVCGAYEVIAYGGRPLATGDADESLGWIADPGASTAGLEGDEAAQQLASDKAIFDDLPGGVTWADDAASALVDAYLDRLRALDHTRYYTAQIAVTMGRLGITSLPDLAAAGASCKGRVSYPTLNRIMTGQQHRREPGTALKLRAMCKELEARGGGGGAPSLTSWGSGCPGSRQKKSTKS